MSRITDGLGSPRVPSPHRQEAKRFAQRYRSECGTTYERIATATGRALTHVYDALNISDDRRHLSYADLIAMSRHSGTRQYVAHLLQPIEQGIKGTGNGNPDGK